MRLAYLKNRVKLSQLPVKSATPLQMAKRTADSADESPYRKRQKLTVSRAANLEKREIKTVQDLKSCLSFNQDDGPEISGQSKIPHSYGWI